MVKQFYQMVVIQLSVVNINSFEILAQTVKYYFYYEDFVYLYNQKGWK